MSNSLLSPPDQAPAVPTDMSRERRMELWADWLDTCEEFLFAGLRRQVGAGGDLREAYRKLSALLS